MAEYCIILSQQHGKLDSGFNSNLIYTFQTDNLSCIVVISVSNEKNYSIFKFTILETREDGT